MTIKEFVNLTGNEYLTYNGMRGSVGKGDIYRILDIKKYWYKFNLSEAKDVKQRKKWIKLNNTVFGGTILIEKVDKSQIAMSKWSYWHSDNCTKMWADYRTLKIVNYNEPKTEGGLI